MLLFSWVMTAISGWLLYSACHSDPKKFEANKMCFDGEKAKQLVIFASCIYFVMFLIISLGITFTS